MTGQAIGVIHDAVLLNRIGIFLNFVAGFLLGPEIIGRARIKRFESALETRCESGLRLLAELFPGEARIATLQWIEKRDFGRLHFLTAIATPALAGLSGVLLWYTWLYSLIAFVALIALAFMGILVGATIVLIKCARGRYQSPTRIHSAILKAFAWAIVVDLTPLIATIAPAIASVAVALLALLATALRILQGHNRLKRLIVWLGVLFFILGNAIQFYATYL